MILQFLPLLLAPLLYALLTKAAAFLFRRTRLSWPHALVFGLLVFLVSGAGAVLNFLAGHPFPLPLTLLLSLAVPLLLGGWYLGPRAKSPEGVSLQFKGGALLALVVYGLVLALGVITAVALPLLEHASKT